MVGLPLAHPKVARCAVRILVLTVRFATSRRQATPPWSSSQPSRTPHAPERGLSRLDRSGGRVPQPGSPHTGQGHGTSVLRFTVRLGQGWRDRGRGPRPGTIKDGGGVGANGTMASLAATRAVPGCAAASPPSRVCDRTDKVPSGGRRKPPWPRTELGEWSPRDEKGLYNRTGGEDLQSRASDGEQVVRLGPLAWLSNPRLAGSSHPAGAPPAVPQGAWNALGRPRSRGLS